MSEKVQEKKYSRCLTAEMRTVLSPSGAYVCPYHRGNKNLQIGDPNTETFERDLVWKKQEKEIMQQLDPRKHCQFHCIRHNTNQLEKIASGDPVEKIQIMTDLCNFIKLDFYGNT